MIITRTSMLTLQVHSMDIPVTEDQLDRWKKGRGELIQNVMPHLTADQREFIMTGISAEEWESEFAQDDKD